MLTRICIFEAYRFHFTTKGFEKKVGVRKKQVQTVDVIDTNTHILIRHRLRRIDNIMVLFAFIRNRYKSDNKTSCDYEKAQAIIIPVQPFWNRSCELPVGC